MIPLACVCILFFSFLHRRRKLCTQLLNGRPGLPRPLHFLDDRYERLFYVGAFSVTTWLLLEAVLGTARLGIPFQRHSKYVVRMFSSVLMALICYPLFAGQSSHHILVYALGTLYVWGMMISYVLLHFSCNNAYHPSDEYYYTKGVLQLIKFLPCLCWLTYLSIVYLLRFVARICGKDQPISIFQDSTCDTAPLPYLLYSHRLMMSKRKKSTSQDKSPAAPGLRGRLVRMWRRFYPPVPGFRYSVSILSAVFVSLLIAFVIAVTVAEELIKLEESLLKYEYDEYANDTITWGTVKKMVEIMLGTVGGKRVASAQIFIYSISICVSLCLTTFSLLLTLRSHRINSLKSYRGAYIELESYVKAPRSVMVNAIRYIGYQFASTIWGFVVQTVMLTMLISIVAVAIEILSTTPRADETEKVSAKNAVIYVLVVVVHAEGYLLIQHIIIHWAFMLRDRRGKLVLAVDNRSVFVNYHYFNVFPNAVRGMIACALRVIYAAVFCLWSLQRLDQSGLSRHFERRDSAFMAYIGLLKMEISQCNPTMLSFVYFLLKSIKNRSGWPIEKQTGPGGVCASASGGGVTQMETGTQSVASVANANPQSNFATISEKARQSSTSASYSRRDVDLPISEKTRAPTASF